MGTRYSIIDSDYLHRIEHPTICQIVCKVCKAIWFNIQEECVPAFAEDKRVDVSSYFVQCMNFTDCIGSIITNYQTRTNFKIEN